MVAGGWGGGAFVTMSELKGDPGLYLSRSFSQWFHANWRTGTYFHDKERTITTPGDIRPIPPIITALAAAAIYTGQRLLFLQHASVIWS